MAGFKLTPAQADFFAERVVWKAQDVIEGNADLDLAGLALVFEGLAPLVELARELSERTVGDPEALRAIAHEALGETRESIGYAAVGLARVRAGDRAALHWPEEKDAQAKSEANYEKEVAGMTEGGVIAQTVFEAIRDGKSEAVIV